MNQCLLCQQDFYDPLTFQDVFSWSPLLPTSMCSSCQQLFTWQKNSQGPQCQRCQKITEKQVCLDCRHWQKLYPHYSGIHRSLLVYNPSLQEWFHQYKFQGNKQLAHSFQKQLYLFLSNYKNVIFVPIPISENRMKKRGFNQVEQLLKYAKIPYKNLILRTIESDSQTSKTKQERISGTNPFKLNKQMISDMKDDCPMSFIIFDDVYTTGRTMYWAIETLQEIGEIEINTCSLARG